MRIILGVAAMTALVACNDPAGTSVAKPPSKMDASELDVFNSLPLLSAGYADSICAHWKRLTRYRTSADTPFYFKAMRSRDLTSRDVEIITDPQADFGTQMTFRGLECSAGGSLSANRSFYQGLGHQWQVKFGSNFIYLEGDGTPEGMRVTSWN